VRSLHTREIDAMNDTSKQAVPAAPETQTRPMRASASQALGGAKLDPPPTAPPSGGIEPVPPTAPGPIRNLNAWL
jgi:hypothetical protein